MVLRVVKAAWRRYERQLAASPVRTQALTSAFFWSLGDAVAQRVSFRYRHGKEKVDQPYKETFKSDWKRVITSCIFGLGFVGPIGHFWYEGLDHVVKERMKLQPRSMGFVGAKLAADTLLFGPLHLIAFYVYTSVATGNTIQELHHVIKRDFIPAFIIEGGIWSIVQIANFKFVPVPYQLLYVNSFCVLDSTFLSWFKHQDDTSWKKWLNSYIS